MKNGLMEVYPSLKADFSVDYAIIGGGITGALIAWYLAKRVLKRRFLIVVISGWEALAPALHLYMRTTRDNRIIVGKDETFESPRKRDKLLIRKTKELVNSFKRKFSEIDLRPDYSWAETFGETKDGLPYIGSLKQVPHTIYALGFGGNGINFSQIAAEIIRDKAIVKKNTDAKIFSFKRSEN